ncbi:MAG: peptide chain release factor N(5)-glutamine methyltransferase [Proteobacteria bacterium]|nr:peptide chain release factor N(5)-glutamine methyltransferase [Pseudomonadota bacterium]
MADTPQTQVWTIRKILDWSKSYFESNGIDSPLLDAQLLLGHVLNMTKMQLLLDGERPLDAEELAAYKKLVIRRARNREPIAYILGKQGFWSLTLNVSPDVLIPRPDTECLVEKTIEFARARIQGRTPSWPLVGDNLTYESVDERKSYYEAIEAKEEIEKQAGKMQEQNEGSLAEIPSDEGEKEEPGQIGSQHPCIHIVDVGTGSGAIILALASELSESESKLTAIDISPQALDVARMNAQECGFKDRIEFLESNLLSKFDGMADIIVSNPPYISSSEMTQISPEVQKEPVLALEAGADGLDVYRKLVPQAVSKLKKMGALIVEIGYTQANAVEALFKACGLTQVRTFRDYGRQPRVVFGLLER